MRLFKLFAVLLFTMSLLLIQSTVFADKNPVKIGSQYFSTFNEAVQTAKDSNKSTKIEIVDDITVDSDIIIESEITLVSSGNSHMIDLGKNKIIINGGKLTLGDAGTSYDLSLLSTHEVINVNEGTIDINDGIKIISKENNAVKLKGSSVTASINGGEIEGGRNGLSAQNGAVIDYISGGTIKGKENAILLESAGTAIKKISGGEFYQTDENITVHGHGVFVDSHSYIGEISGGFFQAKCATALAIIRGGSVGTISGGEFSHTKTGGIEEGVDKRTASIKVIGDSNLMSSIGAITGGKFYGGYFGLLSVSRSISTPHLAQVGAISGGDFDGIIGLQNDIGCTIHKISGGTIHGSSSGMLNNGDIKKIEGSVDIKGDTSCGIFNYNYGILNDISGGTIVSKYSYGYGIYNIGIIEQISGGIIIGELNAICNSNSNYNYKGELEKITGGVFWGKSSNAISLVDTLELEPRLDSNMGKARFWGKDGTVFDDDSLVTLPKNIQHDTMYYMSPNTLSVNGISETGFKYLKLPSWNLKFDANIPKGSDGTGITLPTDQINIALGVNSASLGSPSGSLVTSGGVYVFEGWNSQSDGDGEVYDETAKIQPQPQDSVVTMYAQWKFIAAEEKIETDDEIVDKNIDDTYSVGAESEDIDKINSNKVEKSDSHASSQKSVSQKKIPEKNNPETGDISTLVVLITLLLLAMLVAVSVQLYRRNLPSKRNKSQIE